MIYILVQFRRRTQDAEYQLIGTYETYNLSRLSMFDVIHRERDGYPFAVQTTFDSGSTEGFFIVESLDNPPTRDLIGFVSNKPNTFYATM